MKMARQLYDSPAYIQQQKATLDQILGSINQAGQPAPTTDTTIVQPDTTTATTPVVTQ
jgi:hypothetical protein